MHEARETIAEADSLRAAGVAYDDSLRLDSAYHTLGSWWNRNIHPDDYAGACYYYGRLHRNRGNQVEAMRCFINGTHAQYLYKPIVNPLFSNHSILGGTYTNIGMMCHAIKEFQLAFDMYEKCSEQFKKSNNSTFYYYALYEMSFELAEMNKYNDAMTILNKIENECKDEKVLSYPWITRLKLYDKIEKYDSVIYASNKLQELGNHAAIGYVKKAQAYWHLEQYDSAVLYANYVMSLPYAAAEDKFNMLYILIYNDTTAGNKERIRLTEERADIDKEILDPIHQQVSQAVEILRQDINVKTPYLNIILLLASVCLLIAIAMFVKLRTIRIHKQSITEINQEKNQIEEMRQEVVSLTIEEQQKQNILREQQQQIEEEISTLQKKNDNLLKQQLQNKQSRLNIIYQNCENIKSSDDLYKELCWKDYDRMCDIINTNFFKLATKLKKYYNLSDQEIRLCILVLLEQSQETISQMLNYSSNGIGKFKYRVSKKMGTTNKKLREIILEISVEECVS